MSQTEHRLAHNQMKNCQIENKLKSSSLSVKKKVEIYLVVPSCFYFLLKKWKAFLNLLRLTKIAIG